MKNPKSVWRNDEVKAAVNRKKAARKEVLAASNEEAKERCMIDWFIEEYHAACGTCGTISPRIAGFRHRSLRREDRVRKANRASKLSDVDLARMRERRRERKVYGSLQRGVHRVMGV